MDAVVPVQNKNFSGDGKEFYESFSCRQKNQKSCALKILLNLANLLKSYHGNTERQHLIDPRRVALLREQCAELRKQHLQS